MVKSSLIIAIMALAAGYANAECNNMCSGHGICGANDACTCYRNWRGNDCSERTCQYGVAFINTANGDLDHDGVVEASTLVMTQWAPKSTGGTFELYPDLSNEESHSYMECSNKGLCDRATGTCVCFDGYEGSSCQRTICPNACSGHGVCRNINDKTQALAGFLPYPYPLWDGLKNQACVCDPGYSGVDCALRLCPKGADPLDLETSAGVLRVVETQTVTVDDGSAAIAGSFKLKYTDLFGEVWTTSSITANKAADGSDVSSALTGIPNSVIESVTVSVAATASTNGIIYTITFTANPGDLNQLESISSLTTGTIVHATTVAGTKIASECSGRGLCDYESGLCKCFRGYRLDDCSSQHALAYGSTASL